MVEQATAALVTITITLTGLGPSPEHRASGASSVLFAICLVRQPDDSKIGIVLLTMAIISKGQVESSCYHCSCSLGHSCIPKQDTSWSSLVVQRLQLRLIAVAHYDLKNNNTCFLYSTAVPCCSCIQTFLRLIDEIVVWLLQLQPSAWLDRESTRQSHGHRSLTAGI